ncbi:SMP-30/gluconolactonase/LRE family protein [Kitasatospora sp. A2-31]|uniref:SMP-30/gluconolactonase/LRE family protein n=1 Tax=Kitasatospora sp. A2-31 TaxID=2916414 RepID=UPI001EEB1EA8|nr:SMP-30/gluconolactonase/LRE family protein [Kitasatospora sp. A2-31]MCG6497717.1 SMP-30/gluconolactonase/LRE family protein [Kitasatospora sp. A2-31]
MSRIRTLATGMGLVESPRWHQGRLYVSDWTAGEVCAVGLDGTVEVVASVASLPLCTAWSPDGRMTIVDSARSRLLRREPDGTLTVRAELGALGHWWNDVVIDGRGNTYVNRIGFDMLAGEQPVPGHVTLVTPDGTARDVAGGLLFPNGMAVTPDDSTLVVADSYAGRLVAFDIGPDGSLSEGRPWAELGADAPDGICIDAEGAVWYATVPGRRCVRVRRGGEVLETVELDRGGFSCTLGGPDGRTLFVAAAEWLGPGAEPVRPGSGRVLAVEVGVPGAGRP